MCVCVFFFFPLANFKFMTVFLKIKVSCVSVVCFFFFHLANFKIMTLHSVTAILHILEFFYFFLFLCTLSLSSAFMESYENNFSVGLHGDGSNNHMKYIFLSNGQIVLMKNRYKSFKEPLNIILLIVHFFFFFFKERDVVVV